MLSKDDKNQIVQAAIELFEGDTEAAENWLNTSNQGLGHTRPIEYAVDSKTSQDVLELIGRLEHGII